MSARNEHAIVLGGSMAALLAARVLSEQFARVTLVERDLYPVEAEPRKGVPQGRQLHALLAKGLQVLHGFFPDLKDALRAGGAIIGDPGTDLRWHHFGGYKIATPTDMEGVYVSRPFLEGEVRRRVLALPNVTALQNYDVEGLVASGDRTAVTGATVRNRAEDRVEQLAADLVVDATGRGSQAPKWLAALGYAAPDEAQVKVDVGYTTRTYRRDPADRVGCIAAEEAPAGKRFGMAFPAEGDRWIVLQGGLLGDHAPHDEQGFLDFARTLPTLDVYNVIKDAEPLTDFAIHKFPHSRRRYYERLKRVPANFVAVGDAVCSFNPIFGQGMTVAAVEAQQLGTWLRTDRARDPRRFFKQIAGVVDVPWTLAVGEDFRYPQVTGPKSPGTDLLNAYSARLHRAATHDPVVLTAFLKVAHLLAPPTSLFHPRVVARVLFGRRKGEGASGRRGERAMQAAGD
jgi:2-polyprenyl-6-methoxyphenol hydroxylase-like FAD-dependent oxidoreductase